MKKTCLFLVATFIIVLSSCDAVSYQELLTRQNQMLSSENDSLKKQNYVIKQILANELQNKCDTMTSQQKINWQILQNFKLDLYQMRDREMDILIEKNNKKEQSLIEENDEKLRIIFENYEKNKTAAMEEAAKDSKAFSAYAVTCLKVECDYLKFRSQQQQTTKAPAIKKFLSASDAAWHEKEKAEQVVQQEYQKKKDALSNWYKKEVRKIETSIESEAQKKQKELGFNF